MQLKPSLPLQAVSSHGKCFSASKLNLRASALHHFLLAPTPWTQRADSAPHSSLGDVWPLLSPLPSWLPAPNAPKLFLFWSSAVAPQTCNLPLPLTRTRASSWKSPHGTIFSSQNWKGWKTPPKSSVNYSGGLLTVVTDNLFLVTLSSNIISKSQHLLWTVVSLFWNCLFLTNHWWLSLTVLHFIYIQQSHPVI